MTNETTATIGKAASQRRRSGWIGVDVGTCAVKIAQVESVRGEWRLASSLIVPAGAEIGLPAATRAMLADSPAFSGRRAACVLPASATDFRLIDLPAGSEEEVREMVAQELAMGGGISAGRNEFDFWEIGSVRGEEEVRTYAVLSVSRELARRAADDLLKARLKCEALDGLPFALARAAAVGRDAGAGTVAAVDWGYTSVTFVAAVDGRPIFVRSLRDCGLGLIEDRLGEEFGLTGPERRPLLANYGIRHPDSAEAGGLQAAVQQLAAEPVERLVDELSRTLSFAGRQLRGDAPQELVLFGGGAVVRNAGEYLSHRLGQPVGAWRMPAHSSGGSDRHDGRTALMGAAVGLSLLGGME